MNLSLTQPHLAIAVLGALTIAVGGPASAQVSPETMESISIPNKVETPIG